MNPAWWVRYRKRRLARRLWALARRMQASTARVERELADERRARRVRGPWL